MMDDGEAVVISQLPRPEDIPLDVLQEIDASALVHVLRWVQQVADPAEDAVSAFNNYI